MIVSKKFKIIGMHCTSCAINIDGELEDTDGVKESNTSYAKAQTEVKYDSEKIDDNKIISLIKKVGYSVTLATN